jgi:hypothetical protein
MFYERYFVNEEKKVVVCKLENCAGNLMCDMCEKGYPHHPDLFISDTFVGIAKCSDEDTFDVELGKKIAYKRAVAKLFSAKERAINRFMKEQTKYFMQLTDTASKMANKYANVVARKEKEITHLIGEEV